MKKLSIVLFIGLFLCLTNSLSAQKFQHIKHSNIKIEGSMKYQEGNIYQKDFLLFIDMLKSTHPAFADNILHPFNIDSIANIGYLQMKNCESKACFKKYIQSIFSLLNDGHTEVMPDIDYQLTYPFSIMTIGNDFYLNLTSKNNANYIGKRITKINNNPVKEVLDSFKGSISYENNSHYYYVLSQRLISHYYWDNSEFGRKDSTLVISFADTSDLILKPEPFNKKNLVFLQQRQDKSLITARQNSPFFYNILPEKSICYLQFNKCEDQSDIRIRNNWSGKDISPEIELKLAQIPRFDTTMESMFSKIKEENIKTLVIDVRHNSGGNSVLCNVLLSYLAKQINEEVSQIRISELWAKFYPDLAKEYQSIFDKKNTILQKGSLYYGTEFELDNKSIISPSNKEFFKRNQGDIFNGNIIFIQGEATWSSAATLIIDAYDNKIGKIIGTKSTYRPCNYGDLLAWELPNTQTQGFISHKIFARPDKSLCNELELVPSVKIYPTIDEIVHGVDKCWEWIINNYTK